MRAQTFGLVLGVCAIVATPLPGMAQETVDDLMESVMLFTPQSLRATVDTADAGDPTAQLRVGLAYRYGYGVRAMPEEAFRWVVRAADQGLAAAQYARAEMHRNGEGTAVDETEAQRWFRAAADQEYGDAEYEVGLMYFDGVGVEQDQAEAFRWFTAAADHGSVGGLTFQGIAYVNGLGVDTDIETGVTLIQEAAQRGGLMAQANLGALYQNGVGVARDDREALLWYLVADQGGFEGVEQLVADLTAGMERADVTAARLEARTRREAILMSMAAGDSGGPEDEASQAALAEIGTWLAEELPGAGTFTVAIAREVRGMGRRGSARSMSRPGGGSNRAQTEISAVTMNGCRLEYANVRTALPLADIDAVPTGTPEQWRMTIDLSVIDMELFRVQMLQLPDGLRVSGGQPYELTLRAAGYPSRSFSVVTPDGSTEPARDISIPIADRGEAEAIAERVREAAGICGAS